MEFTVKQIFDCSPEQIYNAWLDSASHSEMTGGAANINNEVGNVFTAWDGYISGKNIVLEPYSRIIQSWRTSEFEKNDPDSQIEIQLHELGDQTELILIHSNLPAHGEQYITGWDIHYFRPMVKYFETINPNS